MYSCTAVPVRLYLARYGCAYSIPVPRYSHLSVFTSLEERQSGRTSGRQAPHLTFVLTAQLKPVEGDEQTGDGVQQSRWGAADAGSLAGAMQPAY